MFNFKGLAYKNTKQFQSFNLIPIFDKSAAKPIIAKAQTTEPETTTHWISDCL